MSFDEQQSSRLRAGIVGIDAQLALLRAQPTSDEALTALTASWKALVATLSLPEEPERRGCPFCSGKIMRMATRCVHCWRKSSADVP